MVNQVTPYGSLTYSQTGQQFVPNAMGGGQYMPAPSGAPSTGQPAPSNGMRGNEPAPWRTRQHGQFPERAPAHGRAVHPAVHGHDAVFRHRSRRFSTARRRRSRTSPSLPRTSPGQLLDHLGKPMDYSGAPALQTDLGNNFTTSLGSNYTTQLGPGYATSYAGADDFSADRQRTEDALWQRGASEREAQENALRTRLTNAGVREGSAAWNAEMERLGRQTTDAQLATYLAGGQEQSRLVELARQAAQFGNDATMNQAVFGNQSALGSGAVRQQCLAPAGRVQQSGPHAVHERGLCAAEPAAQRACRPPVAVSGAEPDLGERADAALDGRGRRRLRPGPREHPAPTTPTCANYSRTRWAHACSGRRAREAAALPDCSR